jgi:hypothetical protein
VGERRPWLGKRIVASMKMELEWRQRAQRD